jgi:hypothetical protein
MLRESTGGLRSQFNPLSLVSSSSQGRGGSTQAMKGRGGGRRRTPSKAMEGGPVIGDGQERPSTRLIPCTSSDAHGWCIVRQGFEYWSSLLLSRRRMLPADRSDRRRRNWWWSEEKDLVAATWVTNKRRHGLSPFFPVLDGLEAHRSFLLAYPGGGAGHLLLIQITFSKSRKAFFILQR